MPLHICLDARLIPGNSGGVEQVATGLMHSLADAPGGNRYSFLVYKEFESHFRSFAGARVELVQAGSAPLHTHIPPWAKAIKQAARYAHGLLGRFGLLPEQLPSEPPAVSRLNPDVVHFNLQRAFLTSRRNVYQPWDLQHLHLPQFTNRGEAARRDRSYRKFCSQASLIVVSSTWGQHDLSTAYGIAEERIRVVPMASPTDTYPVLSDAECQAELAQLHITGPFAYFPAQSWPHKNHIAVVQAIRMLRDRGLEAPVVFSGRQTDHYAVVSASAGDLRVSDLIRHVGFVTERQMIALYRSARLLVFPSLFEGWGLPITEAMALGVPVAASNATCIPEQLGNAGLLFDPRHPEEIADRMAALWRDDALRQRCIVQGRERAKDFTWRRTAEALNSIYAEVAGRA